MTDKPRLFPLVAEIETPLTMVEGFVATLHAIAAAGPGVPTVALDAVAEGMGREVDTLKDAFRALCDRARDQMEGRAVSHDRAYQCMDHLVGDMRDDLGQLHELHEALRQLMSEFTRDGLTENQRREINTVDALVRLAGSKSAATQAAIEAHDAGWRDAFE